MEDQKATYSCTHCGFTSVEPGLHCNLEMEKQCDCGSGKNSAECCTPPQE